ncbi:hypothetical protein ANN_27776 [Periplaneta americana]|uniref:Uncharacterized protein n=1 Tax=Periplaneta americana TaxID=6978 RepID=A0ABQ8RV83_PERAM|nr:hypothetical protein ANN_27776 [Periplaneta americana]
MAVWTAEYQNFAVNLTDNKSPITVQTIFCRDFRLRRYDKVQDHRTNMRSVNQFRNTASNLKMKSLYAQDHNGPLPEQKILNLVTSDEAHVQKRGDVNKQNFRYYAPGDPHVLYDKRLQSDRVTVTSFAS